MIESFFLLFEVLQSPTDAIVNDAKLCYSDQQRTELNHIMVIRFKLTVPAPTGLDSFGLKRESRVQKQGVFTVLTRKMGFEPYYPDHSAPENPPRI